ncbi:BppU family phage baseplate upper protein [Clostridium sporogenes]|uniref:BppU family phage baseplate upper protein n=1 Tax=Clostridium sporogenes TaxID=1509 RepID=UPI003F90E21C
MEKQFNLIIDTKRAFFNAVRGFKQEENNSVLYINLVQNSIPFDLTGLTVRINFKRPDGQVLLQMADVTSATEGKIKVDILTRVLKLVGEVKTDLSIFNKANEKITSAPFSLFIEPSIYTNDYITKNDEFDIIQRVWTSEDERIKAENTRKSNEENRIENESIREKNEKDRTDKEHLRQVIEDQMQDNEAGREKSEATRIENEKTRLENESKRVENEENRVTEESKRVENETTRETNEMDRQQGYEEIKNTVNSFSVCEEYNHSKEYKKYNRVTYNGSSYECLKDCIGVEPTSIEHWICIAEKGKDGLGSGNMHTDTYDKNQNGVVDRAEIADSIEWDNVKNKPDIETQLADITTQQGKNIKQIEENKNGLNTKMNKSGGAFTGIAQAYSNTSYSVRQIRNIIISEDEPNVSLMQDGDIWFVLKKE